MSERVLKNRKKRASKGKNIRISDLVWEVLDQARKPRQSWDSLLREYLGLPNRSGEEQPLIEGWLEINTGKFFLRRAEARGQAVVEAAKQKKKKIKQPIKLREVPQ